MINSTSNFLDYLDFCSFVICILKDLLVFRYGWGNFTIYFEKYFTISFALNFFNRGHLESTWKKFLGETKEWAGEGVVVVEGIPLQFTGLYFTQHPSSLILHTIHQSLERETKKQNNMKSTI